MEQANESLNALSMFCTKYEPATKTNATDTFSGREIIRLINDHTGVDISLPELNKMLTDMHYQYELDDDEFKWMVIKTAS